MKGFVFFCVFLFILSCRERQYKNIDITPHSTIRDSSWKVSSDGNASKVATDSVYVIIGQEILPNGSLHPEIIRRVVNQPYKIGDTAFIRYEQRRMIVQKIEK
jgi:hypothetical protein